MPAPRVLAVLVLVHRRGDLDVGAHTYDPLPVQPFFTVNLGYDVSL